MSDFSVEQPVGTITNTLGYATQELTRAGSVSPRLDAEVLLRHVLGIERAALFMRSEERLSSQQAAAFADLIQRRAAGAPVAYLTGVREFMGLPFRVSPDVLVPRPETELLVEWALEWLADHPGATVVDVGTGSGAIAVSIAALTAPTWHGRVIAADVSPRTLAVAAHNRAALLSPDRHARVRFIRGSLLDWCGGPVDLVLANLPYLSPDQIASNPALSAEPTLALDGGADGLTLVHELVADLPRVLSAGGAAGLELDPSQTDAVSSRPRGLFPAATVEVLTDLSGLSRHVLVQRDAGGHSLAKGTAGRRPSRAGSDGAPPAADSSRLL